MCVSPHLLEKSRMGIFLLCIHQSVKETKSNHMYLFMLSIALPRQFNNHIPLNPSD